MRSRSSRRGRGGSRRSDVDDVSGSEQGALAAELAPRGDYKVMQLCREVERTLASVLAGDLGDGSLGGLVVVSVEPAPDGSRLLVTLVAPQDSDAGAVLARLRGLRGWLRSEIAQVVQRKRVPELAFCLIEEPGPEAEAAAAGQVDDGEEVGQP